MPGGGINGLNARGASLRPGVYTVTLVVSDNAGQTAVATREVTVAAGAPPVAMLNGPTLLDESVANAGVWPSIWDGSTSSDDLAIYKYEWDFGDGATASGGG